jgi:thymidylate synthase (FAD)
MRLIKQSVEILQQGNSTVEEILKHIEICGRVCYKSEDNITDNSAEKFVMMLIERGHTAMLEHGTIYLKIPPYHHYMRSKSRYYVNKYTKIADHIDDLYDNSIQLEPNYDYVTTNYRVLLENDWLTDLQYLCEPTKQHKKRISIRLICDRGVSHELVRHRVFSFAQESTRYCNYSKDKFGNQITFIIPVWSDIKEFSCTEFADIMYNTHYKSFPEGILLESLLEAERNYQRLIFQKWQPQQARAVLPNALKTELIMTGFEDDWKQFLKLRTSSNAHPQMRELALEIQNLLS